MRSYDETDADDIETAQEIRAEPWMLALVKANPDYCGWGPYEDYMSGKGDGWGGRVIHETWMDFGPWHLDDLNECANFYFYVERDSVACEACGQSGLNPESHRISEDFYAHHLPHNSAAWRAARWCDRITQDEVDALIAAGRLMDFTHSFVPGKGWQSDPSKPRPTADDVNRWESGRELGHDAINRWILVETRCKRLGVWGKCEACHGNGYVYTSETARLGLVLWMLHPRKGASRGVDVKNIRHEEIPAVAGWLRAAAERNAARFSKLPHQ